MICLQCYTAEAAFCAFICDVQAHVLASKHSKMYEFWTGFVRDFSRHRHALWCQFLQVSTQSFVNKKFLVFAAEFEPATCPLEGN